MSGMNKLRLLRPAMVAAVAIALAAGAHVTGGGALPAPAVLLALAALFLLPATALSARRFSLPFLGAMVGGGQLVLHQAFTALSSPAACLPHETRITATHVHETSLTCPATTLPAEAGPPLSAADLSMTAAHVLVTAAAVVLLAKSDEAFWLLAAWLTPLKTLLTPPALPARAPRPRVQGAVSRPVSRIGPKAQPLRGPPALPAAPGSLIIRATVPQRHT